MRYKYDELNRRGVYFSRFMDTVGDGSGTVEQAVDGSITPVEFCVTAPAGYAYVVNSLTINYAVTGKLDIGYGAAATALPNGLSIYEKNKDGDVTRNALFQLPIKDNSNWGAYSFDVLPLTLKNDNQSLTFVYDFIRDGAPIVLNPGYSYCVKINDKMTSYVNTHYSRVGMVKVDV